MTSVTFRECPLATTNGALAGGRRFTDIRTAVPDLSDRLLAVRLRELQAEGVLEREVVATASGPARAEYRLTAKGRALRPVIDAVAAVGRMWSAEAPDQAALR